MTDKRESPYWAEPIGNFSYSIKGPFPAGKITPVFSNDAVNIAVELCNIAYAAGFKAGLKTAGQKRRRHGGKGND